MTIFIITATFVILLGVMTIGLIKLWEGISNNPDKF
ncbi:YnaM/YnfT family protein [Raoultella scottii]